MLLQLFVNLKDVAICHTINQGAGAAKDSPFLVYQERSHKEVKEKLYGYGLFKRDVEALISQLIEEEITLNEERFAIQFAGGKFRMKQWGKVKIMMGLKEKYISPYCIKKGLSEIDDAAYQKTLHQLAEKKWASLKGEQYISREGKTRNFLLQRGFESALVQQAIGKLKSEK